MKTIWSLFLAISLAVIFLTMAGSIATEVGETNPYLDNESRDLIYVLNYEIDETYNVNSLEVTESAVTNDSSFEGVDAFARQYLQDKSEIQQKKETLDKAKGLPDLLLKVVGIRDDGLVTVIKLILSAMIVFLIAIAIYKAVRTGETD